MSGEGGSGSRSDSLLVSRHSVGAEVEANAASVSEASAGIPE